MEEETQEKGSCGEVGRGKGGWREEKFKTYNILLLGVLNILSPRCFI
jgi:hypothetical protein